MRENLKTTALLCITLGVLAFFAYREFLPSGGFLREARLAPAFPAVHRPVVNPVSPDASAAGTAPVPGPDMEREEKIAAAIAKYGERPVVMEFMADLRNDPCAAKAIAGRDASAIEALAAARDAGCLDGLKLKYVFRPEFIKLMAEVMSDPELKPLLFPDTPAPKAPPATGSTSLKTEPDQPQ